MMKIVANEHTYILPIEHFDAPVLLISQQHKEEIIENLINYFSLKKKTKIQVVDEELNTIKQSDINFIYISNEMSLDANLELKAKSKMLEEIVEMMNDNLIEFTSVEKIREMCRELETDSGMYKLRKLLTRGLGKDTCIQFDGLDLSTLMTLYSIRCDKFDQDEKLIVYLNLQLFFSRDKITIIYLDLPIGPALERWLEQIDKNTLAVLDNDKQISLINSYNLVIINNSNEIITEELTNSEINVLSYMNNPFIRRNIAHQNEKNIELFRRYDGGNSSFFIKNASLHS